MIRPVTCICMVLAAGSGLYLYQAKHQAQMLDREIVQTLKQTQAARERIDVLRGEWALLNEPSRLAELSKRHLGLQTLAPSQFASMADLGAKLPPPGPLKPDLDPAAIAAADTPSSPPGKPLPLPLPPATPPTRVAAKPAPVKSAAAAAQPPRARSALVAESVVPGVVLARPTPVERLARLSAPPPAESFLGDAPARPRLAEPEPQASVLRASVSVPLQPAFSSALGGAYRALPPPVPFGAAAGAVPGGR